MEDSVNGSSILEKFSDFYEQQLPYYLSIGMSYELYWYGDCEAVKSYRKAEELRTKKQNELLWLQGFYTYTVISDLVPVLNPIAAEAKPTEYMDQPIPLTDEELQAMRENQERKKMEKIMQRMKAAKHSAEAKQKGQ